MPIKNKWLWLFLLLTLMAILNIGVIVTDELANGYKVHWLRYIVNELSGSWSILPLIPLLLWFFKRFPITRSTILTRLPLHLLMILIFGASHTFLMYIVRTPLYQWFELAFWNTE